MFKVRMGCCVRSTSAPLAQLLKYRGAAAECLGQGMYLQILTCRKSPILVSEGAASLACFFSITFFVLYEPIQLGQEQRCIS